MNNTRTTGTDEVDKQSVVEHLGMEPDPWLCEPLDFEHPDRLGSELNGRMGGGRLQPA